MKFTTRPSFELTGLHIHTTWLNNQAKSDIAKLWKRFYKDDIASQLDFSVDDSIYLLYTLYRLSTIKQPRLQRVAGFGNRSRCPTAHGHAPF